MLALLRARLDDLRQALRDPSRPMPAWIWFALATLVSLAFFLWLRLVAVRMAPPERAPAPATSPAGTASGPTGAAAPATPAPRPQLSEAIVAARLESWRAAWVERDLRAWLSFYSRHYGSRGEDLAALAERAAREFSTSGARALSLEGLTLTAGSDIAITAFIETRGEGRVESRARVRLYLLPEEGGLRIFNEEREPLERGSEGP